MTWNNRSTDIIVRGRKVTREEVEEAFNRIKPKGNWKNGIDAIVKITSEFDFSLIDYAAVFFTGGGVDFLDLGCDEYRVIGGGYYENIGS